MSLYTESIRERLSGMKRAEVNPRHVEAWMRVGHPTFDGLSPKEFMREIVIGVLCVDTVSSDDSELLAQSFGL